VKKRQEKVREFENATKPCHTAEELAGAQIVTGNRGLAIKQLQGGRDRHSHLNRCQKITELAAIERIANQKGGLE
jgi:hypothetical protein